MTVASFAATQNATASALHTAAAMSSATQAAQKTAQQASRTPIGRRIIFPAVAAVSIGAAVVMKGLGETMPAPAGTRARADPRQAENQMLMDAYGSAETLEDLQKAMEHYQNK